MEEWSVRDDRPQYYRPEESSHAAWLVPAVVIVLVVGAEVAVVGIHVLAGFDRAGGVADDLAELQDVAAFRDRSACA